MENNQIYKIKTLILGSTGSGKTNILLRHFKNTFKEDQKPTQGSFYVSRKMKYKKSYLEIEVLEIGGSSIHSVAPQAFKGVSGIVFVYDSTDRESFLSVTDWIDKANQNLEVKDIIAVLVAAKTDQAPEVLDEEGQELADKFKLTFHKTSALTSQGIEKMFLYLIVQIVENSSSKNSIIARNQKLQKDSISLNYKNQKNFSRSTRGSTGRGKGCCAG